MEVTALLVIWKRATVVRAVCRPWFEKHCINYALFPILQLRIASSELWHETSKKKKNSPWISFDFNRGSCISSAEHVAGKKKSPVLQPLLLLQTLSCLCAGVPLFHTGDVLGERTAGGSGPHGRAAVVRLSLQGVLATPGLHPGSLQPLRRNCLSVWAAVPTSSFPGSRMEMETSLLPVPLCSCVRAAPPYSSCLRWHGHMRHRVLFSINVEPGKNVVNVMYSVKFFNAVACYSQTETPGPWILKL